MIPSISPVQPGTAVAPMPGAVGDAAVFASLFGGGGNAEGAPAAAVADKAPAGERQDGADGGGMLPDATIDPAWLALILGGASATADPVTAPASGNAPLPTSSPVSLDIAQTGQGTSPPGTGLIRPAVSMSPPVACGMPAPTVPDAPVALPDEASVSERRGGDTPPRSTPTPQFVPAASPTVAPFVATPPTAGATMSGSAIAFLGAAVAARFTPVAGTRLTTEASLPAGIEGSAAIPLPTIGVPDAPMPAPTARTADFATAQDGSLSPTGVIAVPRRIASGIEPHRPVATSAPPTASPPALVFAAGAVASAGELFATAIHAAVRRQPDEPRADPLSLATLAPGTTTTIATTASGGNADPSLDLRHGNWPGAMIDHIEKLRDAADAVDTRIRVVPDALGGIDVSLRRHDDGVQVTLRADQATTQAMLAEARPQLTAMAEARGIRLADAGVSGGTGGPGGDPSTGQGRPQPSFMPNAPASARATNDPSDPADGRVA